MTNDEIVKDFISSVRSVERGIMTDKQKTEHIRVVNHAIQVLTKQITNTLYTQARLEGSIAFLMTSDDDLIRDKRKYLDDDFFVAQKIIETDEIK